MTEFIIIIVIIFFISIIAIFYWLIRPLFKYLARASNKIREDILPGLLELDKTIITICSAAIILTINLIDKSVIGKKYLITSWFAFITCIGIGILILLISFVERVVGGLSTKDFLDLRKESKYMTDNRIEKRKKEVWETSNYSTLLNKILVILIYLLVLFLFLSFLFMIIFGLKNL